MLQLIIAISGKFTFMLNVLLLFILKHVSQVSGIKVCIISIVMSKGNIFRSSYEKNNKSKNASSIFILVRSCEVDSYALNSLS